MSTGDGQQRGPIQYPIALHEVYPDGSHRVFGTVLEDGKLDLGVTGPTPDKLLKVAMAVKAVGPDIFDGHGREEPDEDNAEPYCFECEGAWPCLYEDLRRALAETGL